MKIKEELEKFQKIAVGRELKMIELKKEIKNLKSLLSTNLNNVSGKEKVEKITKKGHYKVGVKQRSKS